MYDLQTLKENDVFAVLDGEGNIPLAGALGAGLYFRDTRFLSLYRFEIEGMSLQLLSGAGELNFMSSLQLTNSATTLTDGTALPARTLSIRRNRFLDGGLHERIGLFNYNPFAVTLTLRLSLGSDFRDMFDVRSLRRTSARGWAAAPERGGPTIRLRYTGLDGVVRTTQVDFDRTPDGVEVTTETNSPPPEPSKEGEALASDPRMDRSVTFPVAHATFDATIPARQPWSLTVDIVPSTGTVEQSIQPKLDASFARVLQAHEEWQATCTRIWTDHELLNALIQRSLQDLRLTMNYEATGPIPVAGIPWFSVPFGRDSLITALQTLCLNPSIAYGTLRFLAQYQGQVVDDWRNEEPGKILHELRSGELAALKEVPHTPYYASIDATPLFIYSLVELLRWTGDRNLVASLRSNLERALQWVHTYADPDGDGFVEYAPKSAGDMRHHAWKDSWDSVQFPDGRQAETPIAPSEVQGYCYAAQIGMAELYRHWGDVQQADELARKAARRKQHFNEAFWMEKEGYYAQALDARKAPVPAVTSNPAHCLLMGMIDGPHADAVAARLVQPDMLSGWGVRTLSDRYPSFNPMSYHNGSVWPHDNSLVVAGLRHAGYDDAALRIMSEVIEAGLRLPLLRLPELYCGFTRDRRYHSAPAAYPTACSPQAWAAASIFLMLQHLVGIQPDMPNRRLRLSPRLLPWLNEIHFEGLSLGESRVSVHVWRAGEGVRCEVEGAEALKVIVT